MFGGGCICTNAISTRSAPNALAVRRPNTLWRVCVCGPFRLCLLRAAPVSVRRSVSDMGFSKASRRLTGVGCVTPAGVSGLSRRYDASVQLAWSLQCPLLVGVGSAGRRRLPRGASEQCYHYLLKVLLVPMTLFWTRARGCRRLWEWVHGIRVGSDPARGAEMSFFSLLLLLLSVLFF